MDRVFRFIYVVLTAPLLALMAAIIPITPVVITSLIATAVAVFGAKRYQARMAQIPVARVVLRGFARVGEFYEENPPKPLIYYVMYPVLAPFWIVASRVARREFLLYRRISVVALVVTVGIGALDYYRNWYPVLPFHLFLGEAIALMLGQLLVTFMLITPVVTTIVIFHKEHRHTSLAVMLAIATLLGGTSAILLRQVDPVTASARRRVDLRTDTDHHGALQAVDRGVTAAAAILAEHPRDVAAAQAAARTELETFYRPDETHAFKVFYTAGVTLLYAKATRHEQAIWLARDAQGRDVTGNLPPLARVYVGL